MDVVEALCRKYGADDPTSLVLSLCRQLIRQAGAGIPTPLEELARLRGILWIDYEDMGPETRWGEISRHQHPGGLAAALIDHLGATKAVLDAGDPIERQRFSLAHEIVHTFFFEVLHEADQAASQLHEQLCDAGAAELLMPADSFRTELESSTLSLGHLQGLATKFRATLQATSRRAMDLSEDQAAVWVVERNWPGQPAPPDSPLLITRIYASRSWPDVMSLQGSPIPGWWVAARAMNGQLELRGTETIPGLGNVSVDAVGYRFQGGRLDGHARAIALVRRLRPTLE
jgi:hypothetical protein